MIQAVGKNKNKDNLLVIHIQIVFREYVRGEIQIFRSVNINTTKEPQ